MPETDNNPVIVPSMQQHRYNKNRLIIGAVLIALGLAITGAIYWKSNNTSSKDETKYAYSYEKTDNFVLAGPSAGSGIRFVKPTEFTPPPTVTSGAEQATLTHVVSQDNKTITLGRIVVASVVAQSSSDDYLKTLDEAIMNPKSTNYENMTQPLKNFVDGRMDSMYNVTLGTANHLINGNIKSNAWLVDFIAAGKTTEEKTKATNFQGQVVLLVGQKAYYYFMLEAVDYNWQSNQKVWQQVIDSIKIDQ